ncbi:hypothetical protein TTHERM_00563850 (macronuclear) [Tetrahymena thermophila SB210]|uniref:Uncharacterized protein n=1 Tax=Tetrahymena thermophila (strain SB210) TaxID=312017 RepID=I7MGM9_TETTS|nr:hypothetical protein TTHERM_00563850 [Tetrahymena thermophila SB210]EAS01739.2 hypothetical protein TTHERM_00563850 [Tetrahymena thermophila SB210]|eukprot:XP_001021984.2 hypothetical protein TTHERM_00563850 [Tetrahymena thermophila SB210]
MDQQDIYHKEKNKNFNKDTGKGQVNIQNWIAQQTENVKLNQHQQKESGSWHQQQQNNFQQQQGFRLNLIQNQQQNRENGQFQNYQQSRGQAQNPIKISNFQEDQLHSFQKDQFGTFNQKLNNINLENIEEFKGSNNRFGQDQNNFYDLQEEYEMQEQNEDEQNDNQNMQNFQNNQQLRFNQSNKHYQLGELLQSHDNLLQSDKKNRLQIQRQDQEIQKNKNPVPQLSMSYERSIQQKLQQEMQAQLQQQQQKMQVSDQQNSSQEISYCQEQKVKIIEKQFQKSVPNKIYTFPRRFSDSEDYDSEGSSSFESLEGVTEYDLNSQNLPKVQRVQNFNQLNQTANRELDNLQKSFQNSIFSIINNQITSNQPPNQQKNNYINFLSLSNLPSDQTNGLDNFTSDGGDKTNLQSDQINELDNFASAGQEAISNSQKKNFKQDLTNFNKTSKLNQQANDMKMKIQDQFVDQKQAQVMKKILKEGKVKFQNTNDQQKNRQVASSQGNKTTKQTNEEKYNQNNFKQQAQPLTIEDYYFDEDDEDDQSQVNNKYNQHNNKDDEDFGRNTDHIQTLGEYDRRLKTEGNDLNYDDDNASEAAHKLYDNNDSEISEDVVIIPLSSNQGQIQNGSQQQLTSSNYSKQIAQDQIKQNDVNFEQHKQILDFSKQKQIQNNNASAISANLISTNNNSNKNFNLVNGGVISTNSQASNTYHSMNSQQNNYIDNIAPPAVKQAQQQQQQQEINDFNQFTTKQNIQRPSSSIQGSNSNNLTQTQKKNKQQQRLMETLKMNFNNYSLFNNQVQNFSQQKQFTKTLSKSKESVSASMNCNTISDLIKKKDISKTTKKLPANQQQIVNKQRETPTQNSKQRQTVYTSIGSMNNYSLIQDQQTSVESGNQHGNNNSNFIDISQNPLPSKVVKRTGSQARDSKLRNHRLKTDSSNPTFQATNQTTSNINNHNHSKVEKSRERTTSASKKKVAITNYSTNQQSKSTNQVDKFKKDVLIQKSNTQKIEKTPIRNKVIEQNSNKNTGSKKTNISNGQFHQQNQSNIIVNQPAQQLLQYAAKQQQKQNQIAQHNMIHKYSSSPDSYATAAANNYLNFQQNPQNVQQLQSNMNIQTQQQQNLNQTQQSNQQIFQQTINQIQQQGAIRENWSPQQKNMNQHLQQQLQQQQQIQQQHILQNPIIIQHFQQNLNNPQQLSQSIQSHQNQIQQILQNAQINLAKQQQQQQQQQQHQQQQLNQKQNIYLRKASPNQIIDHNHITQNKLYQQAKSSLAKFRNEDDTPKQITKSQVLNQGGNKLVKKSVLTSSIDKSSKDKKRVSEKIQDKLKTRIKTEPADYDDQSFIFSSNRNNSSKPHISPQLNSFLLQDASSKGDITKNINLSQIRANKSTTRTRNKQTEKTKNYENKISRGESSAEIEQQ